MVNHSSCRIGHAHIALLVILLAGCGKVRAAADPARHTDFRGSRWCNIGKAENRDYLRNAYRVLLTRARQGRVRGKAWSSSFRPVI
jgi:hypothetical protein